MRAWFYSVLLLAISSPLFAVEQVSVAVASNFTATMQQLVKQFEQDSGFGVSPSYGSTGKLFAQIVNGAPYEIFLAADSERPMRLHQRGNLTSGEPFTYARGELVLWAPHVSTAEQAQQQLRQGQFNFFAMANPKTAPYGAAAMEVLSKLGVGNRYARQTVKGENIAQTYQFIYSGNAQLGFIAKSQLRSSVEPLPGAVWHVPQQMYTPIEQQAILLKRGENNPAAQAFMRFLQTDVAQQLIVDSGYGVADDVAMR